MVQILQTSKKQRSNGLAIVIHIWPKIGGNVMGDSLGRMAQCSAQKAFLKPNNCYKTRAFSSDWVSS